MLHLLYEHSLAQPDQIEHKKKEKEMMPQAYLFAQCIYGKDEQAIKVKSDCPL